MKKGQAWVDVRKLYQRAWKIYINMAAPVLFKLFLAQTHNTSLSGERTTWSTAEPFIKWPLLWWRAPKKSAATEIPDVLQAIWFPELKISYALQVDRNLMLYLPIDLGLGFQVH